MIISEDNEDENRHDPGEYSRLTADLSLEKVDIKIRDLHSSKQNVDGSSKLSHLYAVGELAARHADRLYATSELFWRRYAVRVSRVAGLLHESILAGELYEGLIYTADEAVAQVVADATPDIRLVWPKRIELYANQLGRASVIAQLVKMADVQHTLLSVSRVARMTPAIGAVLAEARVIVTSFTQLDRHVQFRETVRQLTEQTRRLSRL